ncbi:MAG: ChaN family lipoprotein, partial [Planctomycetes bacterium]|nr:ChaN family lipoprotein [Planctomycetota bacterium]
MQKIIRLALLAAILPLAAACANQAKNESQDFAVPTLHSSALYRVESTNARATDLGAEAARLAQNDVVFVGEYHGNAGSHHMQLAVLEELYRLRGDDLVLSMEHFERDVQPFLDQYLNGEIGETPFLANSRPWPAYKSDYRPLIEFCKDRGLDVIAANIPKAIRSRVSKEGKQVLAELSDDEKRLAPRVILDYAGPYRDKFLRFMGIQDASSADPDRLARALKSFAVQCSWDDTMAESITDYRRKKPNALVVHVCGSFHSEEHLGTVERLLKRAPTTKVAVLSPFFVASPKSISDEELTENLNRGDYIYAVRQDPAQFVSEEKRQAFMESQR